MIQSEIIDLIQRRINSIIFRIVLITYAIVILTLNNNYFNNFIYAISIIIFFCLYLYLFRKSILRVINDFLFILFILFGKSPYDIVNFSFLILPLVNSINFSGSKKSILPYFLTLFSFSTLICLYSHKSNFDFVLSSFYPIIPIIFLWIINFYTSLRTKTRIVIENLNSIVDNYYLKREYIKKPHRIYRKLIEEINKSIKKDFIENLICLTITKDSDNNEKLVIVNGSDFIWFFEISSPDFIKRIRDKKILTNENVVIAEKQKKNNLIIYSKVEGQEYIYIFALKIEIPWYYNFIGFFDALEPCLSKISTVLLSEKKLLELKNEEINKLSERSQYVNRANKTMHFIRNRLGPFSNLIKMLDNFDNIPKDKLDQFRKLLIAEKDRAGIELKNITERANDMLEKSKNPFVYNILRTYSVEKIFSILKRNYTSFFPDTTILVSKNISDKKLNVLINEEGFELFLSDWLNNIRKYKKNIVSCEFSIDIDTLVIVFRNDYTISIDDINKMIVDLTSNDRNEIMKRTTHGLFIIKSTLDDMNINYEMQHLDTEMLIELKIIIKTFENENSNI